MDDERAAPNPEPQDGNGLAIAALVCGIAGILCIWPAALAALIMGIIALNKKSGSGRGMAMTGAILGGIGQVVPVVAIIAAIAIPNLIESRVTANEAAARSTLKSGLFPAQVMFQAASLVDQDGDNVGEYGFISELAGRRATAAPTAAHYVQGALAMGDIAQGYRFAVWLPDGAGGAISEPAVPGPRPANAAAANAQERQFVIYAWPQKPGDTGRRVFALTNDGQVRAAPQAAGANPPAWNDVFAGGGWDAAASWPVYAR